MFWNAISLLVICCYDVSSATRFPCRGIGPRRVGWESGGSGHRRGVGSNSCGSFIGRECYEPESWVDLLSSHVTSIFQSDVPKYRRPSSFIKVVFRVPDRTLSKNNAK